MRLPILGRVWPSRTAPHGLDPEMPPMVETAQSPDGLQPREASRSRSQSNFGRQVLALVRGDRPSSSATPSGRETGEEVESPKTPQFQFGRPALPSARMRLPYLTRAWTAGLGASGSRPPTASANQPQAVPGESWPRPSSARFETTNPSMILEPPRMAAATGPPGRERTQSSSGGILGQEPRNLLAQEARARGAIAGGADVAVGTEDEQTAQKFMGCFPWVHSQRVRSQISRCLASGAVLVLLLTTYLSLSLTQSLRSSEFTVLLILVVIFTTIVFCHGLIRLCTLVTRARPDDDRSSGGPGIIGFAGRSLPRRPVRVLLARDEEAAGIESETTKLRPPAYGLWRESVRVDPNRLFWQRNEEETRPSEASTSPETQIVQRPPSYASDDGVGYIIDAVPRSTAPTADVSLPAHPSERGRLGAGGTPW